jgi:hypothetical protein
MACQRPSVHKYGVIADQAIMADMSVRHDQVAATNAGDPSALNRSPIHRGELAKLVCVAYLQRHPLASVCQILRIATNDGKRINVITASEPRGALYHGVMLENAAFAQVNLATHYREGSNLNVTSDTRGGRNLRTRINLAH